MSQLHPGDALGASYRLSERIGSGAAGDVWIVEPTAGGTNVAAKILKVEHAQDPELVERFIRERSVLLGLRHENIVEVRDLIVEGANLAIVMDYLPGGSLRDLLSVHGPLPASDALILTAQVFRALALAHQNGITHRDIKPDNILLAEAWSPGQQRSVRVTDFGIAAVVNERLRVTTGLLGTPHYMAPELISHGQTTSAADVYSTGILLYELLSGRTPFAGPGTDFTVAYRHVTSRPPQLELPGPLWAALHRLLGKDPRERPDAAQAAAELSALAVQFADLPALAAGEDDQDFEDIERPATLLRSDLLSSGTDAPEYVSPLGEETPELGDGAGQTMLRSLPRASITPRVIAAETDDSNRRFPSWMTRKTVLLGAAGLVLIAGLGFGAMALWGGKTEEVAAPSTDQLTASQQDQVLPTGLTVSRAATFDPDSKQITLDITYAAQKAPLSGEFFQIIPALGDETVCPAAIWTGAQGARHQPSTTGVNATCGWRLEGVQIPSDGRVNVSAVFPATVTDAAALDKWLGTAASETAAVMTAADTISTAYPAQRLQNISVNVAPRTVSQTPLLITLLPVWPSGPDELNPLFRSPATGDPSSMLRDIAGSTSNVRFSDACSGAVAVSADGLTVTTMSVASDCRLRAVVGNFTNLESSPFSITTRE